MALEINGLQLIGDTISDRPASAAYSGSTFYNRLNGEISYWNGSAWGYQIFTPANIGTGTADAGKFLRGDGAWAAVPPGGTPPTGTGYTHQTAGVTDAASVTPANLKTDLALVKADVGLGSVDNTSDSTKNSAVATLTNKTIDGGTY